MTSLIDYFFKSFLMVGVRVGNKPCGYCEIGLAGLKLTEFFIYFIGEKISAVYY